MIAVWPQGGDESKGRMRGANDYKCIHAHTVFLSRSLSLSCHHIFTYISYTCECLLCGGLVPSNSERPLSLHAKQPGFSFVSFRG